MIAVCDCDCHSYRSRFTDLILLLLRVLPMDIVGLKVTRQATVVAPTFGVVGHSGVAAPCRVV